MVQNATKSEYREDDVTIKRVNLTRDEFDQSLLEYERHKSEMKTLYEEKRRERQNTDKPAQKAEKLELRVSMNELEKSLLAFKMGSSPSNCEEIVQRENGLEKWQVCVNSKEIGEIRTSIQETIDRVLNIKNPIEKSQELATTTNLNELYKWVQVEKKSNMPTNSNDSDNNQLFDELYSNYFVQYYKHYFNKFYSAKY